VNAMPMRGGLMRLVGDCIHHPLYRDRNRPAGLAAIKQVDRLSSLWRSGRSVDPPE
jgi:hypothetical protein